MTLLALTLVLLSAVLHAVWNLAAKRAGGGLPFVFVTGLVINILYLPVVIGYVLILTAMTFTPVSYVAPARESSILIGAAACIVVGIVLLAVG